MRVYLQDNKGVLCFRHAVKKALNEESNPTLEVVDDDACGQSGCWWIGSCYECEKENK